MRTINWNGLYSDSWQGEIVPEAFSHPAKYSRALIGKIYSHMLESGWIKPGDKVIDPFGGVALGAYHALQNGLVWCGCELESKFVDLGNQNIDLWNNRYAAHFAKWGTAVLVQGDSRNLAANIQGHADSSVSSAPFVDQKPSHDNFIAPHDSKKRMDKNHCTAYGDTYAQLANMSEGSYDAAVSSSPFGAGETRNRSQFQDGFVSDMMSRAYTQDKQGVTNGNLAHLETKESDFQAAVSSPAYVDTVNSGDGPGVRHDPKTHKGDNAYKASSQAKYGNSNGQLGGMNGGGFEAAVSSSPFVQSLGNEQSEDFYRARGKTGKVTGTVEQEYAESRVEIYNPHSYMSPEWLEHRKQTAMQQNIGRLPNDAKDPEYPTFWSEAKKIVEQTYMVLKPGAYAAFVCGDFVRGGKRVYFGRQWMELCQAVGFEPIEWAVAWKTEYKGNQLDIFGNDHEKRIDRVSFFRRLANEKNPDNAILNEDVIFMRKPL